MPICQNAHLTRYPLVKMTRNHIFNKKNFNRWRWSFPWKRKTLFKLGKLFLSLVLFFTVAVNVVFIVETTKRFDGDATAARKGRPGVDFIFPLSLILRPNKLEGLSLETLSSQVLEFEGKARANPIGVPFRCFLLG